MMSRSREVDPWRTLGFWSRIDQKRGRRSQCPEREEFVGGATLETMSPYSARVYVVYELRKSDAHSKGSNQFFLGWADKNHGLIKEEVMESYEEPTEYFHHWMRARQPTFEEAVRNMAVTYLWHYFFPKTWGETELSSFMEVKLHEWIERYWETGRLLNTKALPRSVVEALPSSIASSDKHLRLNVAAALEAAGVEAEEVIRSLAAIRV